jgi:hypothetical protein
VRLLVEDDLPWLHSLFTKRYPERYDAATTERWFRNVVVKDAMHMYAARTDAAFIVAMQVIMPWLPGDPEVNVVAICADDGAGWQVVKLLRDSIDWARKRNATIWRFASDTEYNVWPLAERVGARRVCPRYEINLREDAP